MSIANKLMRGDTASKFIIPCTGKMFHSSMSRKDKALCHCLNKGYIETSSREQMGYLVDDLLMTDWAILVGNVDAVRLKTNVVRYRQRLFFRSVVRLVEFCKRNGVLIDFTKDFRVNINSVLFCAEDLRYLERYARSFDRSIDSYLTETCIVQLSFILRDKNVDSPVHERANNILNGKVGYLDRAPMMVGTYNIEKHTSSVYIPNRVDDIRAVSKEKWGYVDSIVADDRKAGVFADET